MSTMEDSETDSSVSVQTFDEWKNDPSTGRRLTKVELLSALVYGSLTIYSEEGSNIVLETNFHVDSAGVVKTTARLNIVHRRLVPEDVEYPDGPVQANFFQTDHVTVGEPFQIMTYDRQTRRGVIAVLKNVVELRILRGSADERSGLAPTTA